MGQGHIQKTTGKGTRRIPQVNAQPTAPDTSTSSVANTSFVQNVHNEPDYAQQAPGSSTITTLPENSTISILTPEQMSTLGPPIPERPKVEFGELTSSSWDFPKIVYSATLAGVEPLSRLAVAICRRLSHELGGASPVAPTECAEGIKISFEDLVASRATGSYRRLGDFITNLQALGVGTNDIAYLIELDSVWQDLAARTPWHFYGSRERRKECIKALMSYGLFQPALLLLSDFMKVDASIIKDFALPFVQNELKLSTFVEIKGDDLRALKSLVCCDLSMRLNHFTRAGAMVLQDIATIDNNSSELEPYQIFVFEAIASKVIFDEHALEKLLDLPGIVPGDLFQNPKARKLLLIAFPDLRKKVFEPIEGRAYDVFCDRRQRLEDEGVVFSGGELDWEKPFEIIAGPIDASTVDKLLDLAEAAVLCAGRIQYAAGVLQFLSEQVLDDDQIERAVKLRDRIQMAVRFDPLPELAATFDTVKTLTDDAIKELVG